MHVHNRLALRTRARCAGAGDCSVLLGVGLAASGELLRAVAGVLGQAAGLPARGTEVPAGSQEPQGTPTCRQPPPPRCFHRTPAHRNARNTTLPTPGRPPTAAPLAPDGLHHHHHHTTTTTPCTRPGPPETAQVPGADLTSRTPASPLCTCGTGPPPAPPPRAAGLRANRVQAAISC